MKAPSSIMTPQDYLEQLPEDRRKVVSALHREIRAAAPELKPHIAYGMLGYGPIHYRTRSGCEGDWFVVGLASQKNYLSLYICRCDGDGYLVEKNKSRLGKVSVGKSCIRFKCLKDLNLKAATSLVRRAAKLAQQPGRIVR